MIIRTFFLCHYIMAGVSKTRRALYKKVGKRSLCRGKRTSKPNKCTRVKHCKVASGKRRTYCRKKRARRYSKRSIRV